MSVGRQGLHGGVTLATFACLQGFAHSVAVPPPVSFDLNLNNAWFAASRVPMLLAPVVRSGPTSNRIAMAVLVQHAPNLLSTRCTDDWVAPCLLSVSHILQWFPFGVGNRICFCQPSQVLGSSLACRKVCAFMDWLLVPRRFSQPHGLPILIALALSFDIQVVPYFIASACTLAHIQDQQSRCAAKATVHNSASLLPTFPPRGLGCGLVPGFPRTLPAMCRVLLGTTQKAIPLLPHPDLDSSSGLGFGLVLPHSPSRQIAKSGPQLSCSLPSLAAVPGQGITPAVRVPPVAHEKVCLLALPHYFHWDLQCASGVPCNASQLAELSWHFGLQETDLRLSRVGAQCRSHNLSTQPFPFHFPVPARGLGCGLVPFSPYRMQFPNVQLIECISFPGSIDIPGPQQVAKDKNSIPFHVFRAGFSTRVSFPRSLSNHSPFPGVRIGEALQPGPQDTVDVTFAVINPTAILGKASIVAEVNAQVVLASETSATVRTQQVMQRPFRAHGFTCHWSQPVPEQVQAKSGECRRGLSIGTAIFSKLPSRMSLQAFQPEQAASCRINECFVRIGPMEIKVIAIYGWPMSTPEASARNNLLIAWAYERATSSRVPALIGGDFNVLPQNLPVWQSFEQQGWVEAGHFMQRAFQVNLPPTCKGATRHDTFVITPGPATVLGEGRCYG